MHMQKFATKTWNQTTPGKFGFNFLPLSQICKHAQYNAIKHNFPSNTNYSEQPSSLVKLSLWFQIL